MKQELIAMSNDFVINRMHRPDLGYDQFVVTFSDEAIQEYELKDTCFIIDSEMVDRWLTNPGWQRAFLIICDYVTGNKQNEEEPSNAQN